MRTCFRCGKAEKQTEVANLLEEWTWPRRDTEPHGDEIVTTEFDVATSETGKIICFLTGDKLEPKPEEWVRQKYLRVLHYEYRYPEERHAPRSPGDLWQ